MEAALRWESDGLLGRVRLTRPHVRNALNWEMNDLLERAIQDFADRGIRIAVLEADPPVFTSGADLAQRTYRDGLAASECITRQIHASPLFWISVVDGPVVGAGCAVVAACPMVLASDQAWLSLPEIGLGIVPDGVLAWLTPVVGTAYGARWALTGRPLSCAEAVGCGLVSERAAPGQLRELADRHVRQLLAQPEVAERLRLRWQEQWRPEEWPQTVVAARQAGKRGG